MKLLALAALAASLLHSAASAEVTAFTVKPSTTDPQITTDDDPHWIFIERDIVIDRKPALPADRHELFLWLPGTGDKPGNGTLLTVAADLGYHVVNLMYNDDVAANQCDYDSDPHTFTAFRQAIIAGGQATYQNGKKDLKVSRADSIENRLIKLLQRLQSIRPRECWDQFLTSDGNIKWETIAVGGISQGGGHAAFIGAHHRVERVLCFGAPKDYNMKLKTPASWYSEKLATPVSHFFAFNHTSDANSCTPEEMFANIQALGIPGPRTIIDGQQAPYGHSHILYTSEPPINLTNLKGADRQQAILAAHASPVQSKFADRLKPVWTYMLTEPVK